MLDGDREELLDETRRIWDANAEWWDDKIGDGNDFQRYAGYSSSTCNVVSLTSYNYPIKLVLPEK